MITYIIYRGGSRAPATSKMERFVIIVNGFQPLTIITKRSIFQPLTIITKRSILDVAAALDLPLKFMLIIKVFSKKVLVFNSLPEQLQLKPH